MIFRDSGVQLCSQSQCSRDSVIMKSKLNTLGSLFTGAIIGLIFALLLVPLSCWLLGSATGIVYFCGILFSVWLACLLSGLSALWSSLVILGTKEQILDSWLVFRGKQVFNETPLSPSQTKIALLSSRVSLIFVVITSLFVVLASKFLSL